MLEHDLARVGARRLDRELLTELHEKDGVVMHGGRSSVGLRSDRPRHQQAILSRRGAAPLADRELHALGYGLIIHDGYRHWYVTKIFWDATPNFQKQYVAAPKAGSRHNRGCAVDLSLFDLKTGEEVAMPSGYDEMNDHAYANYRGGTADERHRRAILRAAMVKQGFQINPTEWWHFDYKDWRRYPIGNLRFEDLGR